MRSIHFLIKLSLFFVCCSLNIFLKTSTQEIFSTIHKVKQYALEHPEHPDIDNIDWAKPDYSSFLKTLTPGYYDRFLQWIGFRKPLWTADALKSLLEELTKERELNGYIGRFILKIDPTSEAEFIIFGDLHGAFHSFVRNLIFLEVNETIHEDLSLKPNCYFVFNGNLIDQSPYSLELLTLVLQIMQKNPGKVIYIRGQHEDKEEWHNYSLKTDLSIRAQYLDHNINIPKEHIPLGNLINRFFDTLPLAIYVVANRTAEKIDVIRISHYGADQQELNEKNFAGFFDVPGNGQPQLLRLSTMSTSQKKISVQALITGEKLDVYYKKTSGLRSLGKEKGINTWSILSSPIDAHRRLYEFFYDAFAVLKIYPQPDDWKLELYNQDVRSMQGFTKSKVYNILTGLDITGKEKKIPISEKKDIKTLEKELETAQKEIKELKQNIQDVQTTLTKTPVILQPPAKVTELTFGTTLDLTGKLSNAGKAYKDGMLLAIDEINNAGGAQGIKLKLDPLDDDYNPAEAQKNIQELITRGINILIAPLGSSTLNSYINLVKEKKILVLFPATGAMTFRNPELNYIINYRISNSGTAAAMTEYMFKNGAKKFAFLYRDDDLGKNALEGATSFLKTQGITEWIDLPLPPDAKEFQKQIEILKSKHYDTLGFFTLASCTMNFIKSAEPSILSGKNIFGIDPLTDPNFQNFAQQKALTVAVPYHVPNPQASDLPIVKEYVAAANQKQLPINPLRLEGYLYIRLLADVINNLQQPVTPNNIVTALESLKDYDLKGIKLTFDKQTRTLIHPLWIYAGKPEWSLFTLKKLETKPPEKTEPENVIEGSIKLGSTMDLSRSEKYMGNAIQQVLSTYIGKINQQGGIKGKTIDLTILDDGYNPKIALNNAKNLSDQGIGLLINPLGSITLANYLHLVKDKNSMVFFPIGNSPIFYDSQLQFLLNFGPSYYDEGYYVVKFANKNVMLNKIVIFYQENVPQIIKGTQAALKELEKDWTEIPYNPASVDYKRQVAQMKKVNPDTIFFATTSTVAINLIRQMGIDFFISKNIFGGLSFLNTNLFKTFMQSNGLKYAIPSNVPNPTSSALPIVKEFREFAQAHSIELNPVTLLSYISINLLNKFISDVDGILTWEKIMWNAEQLNNFDLGGMKFSFDPQTRKISDKLWIDSGTPEWKEVTIQKTKDKIIEQPATIKTAVESKTVESTIKGPIKIGSTMDLSKGIRSLGLRIRTGTQLAVDAINAKGGASGRLIDLTVLDDEYNPKITRKLIEQLLDNNVDIILNPLGSPTLESYLDLIKEKKVLVLFPNTGCWPAYKPEYVNLINFRASYYDVGYVAASYAVDQLKAQKIVVFFQDDVVGEPEGTRDAFNVKNFKNWTNVTYPRNAVNFQNQASKIKAESPDVIILHSVPTATKEIIRQTGVDFMATKKLIGGTDHSEKSFKDFLNDIGLHMTIISPVPNPVHSEIEIAKEFREKAAAANVDIGPWTFNSYIGIALFIYGVEQLQGNISKDSLRIFYENLKNVNFKGLELNFNPETRQLQPYVWIDTGEKEWIPMKGKGLPAK